MNSAVLLRDWVLSYNLGGINVDMKYSEVSYFTWSSWPVPHKSEHSVLYLPYKFGAEYLKELTKVSWTLVLTIVYNLTYFIH